MLLRTLLTIFVIKSPMPISVPEKDTFYPFSAHVDIGCDPPYISPDDPNALKNITKNIWLQSTLNELESFRISNKDKLELAKEILDLFDDDIINTLGHNIMAGGVLDDWNFNI